MICQNCGYNNADDSRFCVMCGKTQEATGELADIDGPVTCSLCGTKNEIMASYCRACGEKILGSAPKKKRAAKAAPKSEEESPKKTTKTRAPRKKKSEPNVEEIVTIDESFVTPPSAEAASPTPAEPLSTTPKEDEEKIPDLPAEQETAADDEVSIIPDEPEELTLHEMQVLDGIMPDIEEPISPAQDQKSPLEEIMTLGETPKEANASGNLAEDSSPEDFEAFLAERTAAERILLEAEQIDYEDEEIVAEEESDTSVDVSSSPGAGPEAIEEEPQSDGISHESHVAQVEAIKNDDGSRLSREEREQMASTFHNLISELMEAEIVEGKTDTVNDEETVFPKLEEYTRKEKRKLSSYFKFNLKFKISRKIWIGFLIFMLGAVIFVIGIAGGLLFSYLFR